MVGCGFFPDAVVGRELFFLPWPSLVLSMVMVCIANDIHQHNAIHIVIVLPCTYHCDCCIDGRIEILDILIDLIEWGDLNFQALLMERSPVF